MPRVTLDRLVLARSGDKGRHANVGVVARSPAIYAWMLAELSAERVAAHFDALCRGGVERYELPNLLALNFVLRDALDGGGTETLRSDAQGKTYGLGLLGMWVEIDDHLLPAKT